MQVAYANFPISGPERNGELHSENALDRERSTNKDDRPMHGYRVLSIGTTLVLIFAAEFAHASLGDYDPVAQLKQSEKADSVSNTSGDFIDPGLPINPNVDLWVSTRGRSDKYVIAHLKAAATRHGLSCVQRTTPGPHLQCHFQGDSHEAILAYDEDDTGLRVEVYYLDNAFEKIDAARKKTIDAIVHQFANDVKRSGKVRSIERCGFPHLNCESLWVPTSGPH
jgi:hypothetical protein